MQSDELPQTAPAGDLDPPKRRPPTAVGEASSDPAPPPPPRAGRIVHRHSVVSFGPDLRPVLNAALDRLDAVAEGLEDWLGLRERGR